MNIDNAIARAQKMMLSPEWNRQVEMGAAAHRAGSINGNSNKNDLAMLEAQAFGGAVNNTDFTPIPASAMGQNVGSMITDNGKPIQLLQEQSQTVNIKNSKLPKNIVESFAAMPSLSGDEGYGVPPAIFAENVTTQQINEAQQYIPQNSGIDYNALKYIINECIKENMKTLNESSGTTNFRGMRIAEGSVIQFIDSKGNLYEGKLTLKKRAK